MEGLAVGMYVHDDISGDFATQLYTSSQELRVGHSEIKVDLDTSEVDVTITGIAPVSLSLDSNGELVTSAGVLRWEGIPLNENGLFVDPDFFREYSSLEDTFATKLLPEGERYVDKAYSIKGQFYGDDGSEVVGTFHKDHYMGSFGAYKEQQ